jgi:hypothetical protein
MSTKKKLLLAGMALVAVAFSAPATASAGGALRDIDKGTATIAKDLNFLLSGQIEFNALGSGFKCESHVSVKTKLADEFLVTGVEITTKKCTGLGIFETCTVSEDQTPGLPWLITVNSTNVQIQPVLIDVNLTGCAFEYINVEAPSLIGTPATGFNGGIIYFTLSGTASAETEMGTFPVAAGGTLAIQGAAADTYEIEEAF